MELLIVNKNIYIEKYSLHDLLLFMKNDTFSKIVIFLVMWLILFISYYIVKTLNVLFLMIMSWILNVIFGMKLKFGNYYRLVVYAITLPLIVELISFAVLQKIPGFAVFAYQLLAYIYIFYGLRAIRLDLLIITTPGNNFKEKIDNMMKKLEDELEAKKESLENNDEENKNEDNKEKAENEKSDDE